MLYHRTKQLPDLSTLTPAHEQILKQQVLDQLILNTVSLQSARAAGFFVDEVQANEAILSIPQFQEDGHFSTSRYAQILNGALFTPESFQKEVRQGMLLNQQRFAWIGTAFVLQPELDQFVGLYLQTRDYAYVRIPLSQFLDQVAVSPREIKAYYTKHRHQFLTPERVSIDYVLLSMDAIKGKIKVSSEEIAQAILENKVAYDAEQKKGVDVEAEVRAQLLQERAEQLYTHTLEQLTDLSYQSPDSLDSVAQALHISVQQTDLFSRSGGDAPFTQHPQVLRAAFSHDVLKFGNNSEPIQLDNDSVVVLRVKEHIPSMEKPLADVEQDITKTLAHDRATLLAKEAGLRLIKEQQAAHATQIASDDSVPPSSGPVVWQQVQHAGRDTETVLPAINLLAFELAKVGDLDGRPLPDGDFVVVQLKQVNPGHMTELDKEQIASIKQQIEANYGLMDYDLYMNGLVQAAKIVPHT
jgi:hypothetical protein